MLICIDPLSGILKFPIARKPLCSLFGLIEILLNCSFLTHGRWYVRSCIDLEIDEYSIYLHCRFPSWCSFYYRRSIFIWSANTASAVEWVFFSRIFNRFILIDFAHFFFLCVADCFPVSFLTAIIVFWIFRWVGCERMLWCMSASITLFLLLFLLDCYLSALFVFLTSSFVSLNTTYYLLANTAYL